LEKQSPLNSADKIKTPLLVVQGANDPRVNKRESDQIVVALRDEIFRWSTWWRRTRSRLRTPRQQHGGLAATESFLRNT